MEANRLKNDIFNVDKHNFNELALQIFHFQVKTNPVYSSFVQELGIAPNSISDWTQIPHLPISFFKSKDVIAGSRHLSDAKQVFMSSATTGSVQSKHYVFDPDFYFKVSRTIFEENYGNLNELCVLALLPGYLERGNSSLVYMTREFIRASGHKNSGFYLDDFEGLLAVLEHNSTEGIPTLLLGVSFALLDFAEKHKGQYTQLTVMDTGGMKGRRKELIKEELHEILCAGFGVDTIHSEYGMTELMSQFYSRSKGHFCSPNWCRVSIRDTSDPLSLARKGKTGGINIIDLANIDSCSFIATQDLGRELDGGKFEVMGRFDHSDIRGCNLLYA